MQKTYTTNQTGAITIQWGTALWSTTVLATSSARHDPNFMLYGPGLFWVILGILSWIWIPLMVMRVKMAFLLSLIQWIVYYIGHIILITVILQVPGWWTFVRPWLYLTFLIVWLAGLAAIYFNYKSYQELLAKAQ